MERRQVVRGDQMRLHIADCSLMQPILVFVSRVEKFFSPVNTHFSTLTFWRFIHLFQVCTFVCALAGFHTTPFIGCCISLYQLRRWNQWFYLYYPLIVTGTRQCTYHMDCMHFHLKWFSIPYWIIDLQPLTFRYWTLWKQIFHWESACSNRCLHSVLMGSPQETKLIRKVKNDILIQLQQAVCECTLLFHSRLSTT
jgi:hypothetical protein